MTHIIPIYVGELDHLSRSDLDDLVKLHVSTDGECRTCGAYYVSAQSWPCRSANIIHDQMSRRPR